MSVTNTEIANQALDMLGETSVLTDLDTDNSVKAKALRRHYEATRRAILMAYPWNFATKRASLTAESESPVYPAGFYHYALPSDCLQVRDIDEAEPTEPWSVELKGTTSETYERVLMIERAGPLKILYTADISRLDIWSQLARDAFTALLASRVAMAITNKQSAMQLAVAMYGEYIGEARTTDAREGSATILNKGPWAEARW